PEFLRNSVLPHPWHSREISAVLRITASREQTTETNFASRQVFLGSRSPLAARCYPSARSADCTGAQARATLRLWCFDRSRRLHPCRAAGKRQQGDIACSLDGYAKPALVTSAHPGHAARQNLSALLHELRKNVSALVVDEVHLLHAELAHFLLAEILALAAAR